MGFINSREKVDAQQLENENIEFLWVDDIVLTSELEQGLKNSIKKPQEYCNQQKIIVDTDKTRNYS